MSRGGHKTRYLRLSEEDLVGLVGGGDADAFAALYDRHSHSAYALAHKLTLEESGDRQAGEELGEVPRAAQAGEVEGERGPDC